MTSSHPNCFPSLLLILLSFLLSLSCLPAQQPGTSPVKIFILAGQSNMVGVGTVSAVEIPGTLDHTVANDPAGDYQFLTDGAGGWKALEDTWIHYERNGTLVTGDLEPGYGNVGFIGPELGFGHLVGGAHREQVLIVKAAWGGKSLAVNFRPPSSGWSVDPPVAADDQGFYYNEILRLVNHAIANLGAYFPDYNAAGGYEIAGFGWHQGWNDHISPTFTAEYTANMANFINDMRDDLGVPGLPFVIATSGMASGGSASYSDIELAQLEIGNATAYPEFVGNVEVVDTKPLWIPAFESPSGDGTHWNRNGRTYIDLGVAMGEAMEGFVPGACPHFLRVTGDASGVTLSWGNGSETPTSVQVFRNGAEIAAAAPGDPPSFLDSTALPGVIDYELVFAMPGGACDPLTFQFDGAIRDFDALRRPGHVELTWTNAMPYAGIEVLRDGMVIEPSLAGTATTYTDASPPAGGVVTYTVVPTDGSATPSTAQVNLDALFADTFDRPDSTDLNASTTGKSGTLGTLNYTARTFSNVILDITGGLLRIDGPAANGSFGGLVYLNDHNFTDAAIVSGGGFSVSVDIATYLTAGSGRQMCVGVGQSLADLDGQAGVAPGDYVADLLVAYRGTTDTLEIYKNGVLVAGETVVGGLPAAPTTMRIDYVLGDFNAGSTVNFQVYFDDSETSFTSGSFSWSGANENYISLSSNLSKSSVFDNLEIATAAFTLDLDPPTPSPMTWASPPAAVSENQITMTATAANDPSGVEYYFSNTTVGGHDSGWQNSPSWTDTGLDPSTSYSYTVKARDKSPNHNETAASTPPASATTDAADTTAPTPNPMTWATPPEPASSSAITMTATTAGDPSGVEYYFSNTTLGSHDSGWQDSPSWTDTGLAPSTSYSYTVKARDKSPGQNETDPSTPPASVVTEAVGGGAILFADTFDRPDAWFAGTGASSVGDINGNNAGKSGSLGNLTWTARAFAGNTFGVESGALTQFTAVAGLNGGLAYINDHNFIDAVIAAGGGFSIEVDIVSYSTGGSGRSWTVGVGQSLADLDGLTANDNSACRAIPTADLLVGYRKTTGVLEIHKNGTLESSTGGLPNPPTTMRIDYALSDFNAGSAVNYEVYFDDGATAFKSGSFSWGETNQNYISVGNNLTGNSNLDNFEIRANGSLPPASDYDDWSENYPGADLSDPGGDHDGDGLSNDEERIWGTDPTSASSVNPISVPLDAGAGALSYTRRDPALSGLTHTIWTSSNLADWTEDTGAVQTPGDPDENDVETVAVTITATPVDGRLFARIQAVE